MAYKKYFKAPYRPGQKTPYTISRSKIEMFTQCKRCFWLEARQGIKRPSSPPFNINKAIDELYKNEFDTYRKQQKPHPIMVEYDIKAVPFVHKNLDTWRNSFKGIRTVNKTSNLEVFGGIDDVWVDNDSNLIVVDYKATAKDKEVNLEAHWQQSYKRQLEIYQWLLRQNGFDVSNTGYFVYTNAIFSGDKFGDELKFKTKVIPHEGQDKWIEPTLVKMHEALEGDIPEVGEHIMGGDCEYCTYAKKRTMLTMNYLKNAKK